MDGACVLAALDAVNRGLVSGAARTRLGRRCAANAFRMRPSFGCDLALDARRVTGAGRVSVAPHFNALPHFLLAGKLCRGIGDFVWREQLRC